MCSLRKIDVLDVIKKLGVISEKAKNINAAEIEIGPRVLENRVIVLEGYLNFLDRTALPTLQEISEKLLQLGNRVYLGGESR